VQEVAFPSVETTAPTHTTENLVELEYGKPDPEVEPRRDKVEYLTPAEADRRLSRPLSDAQRAGVAAQIAIQGQRNG
jgi:hypothetical protein